MKFRRCEMNVVSSVHSAGPQHSEALRVSGGTAAARGGKAHGRSPRRSSLNPRPQASTCTRHPAAARRAQPRLWGGRPLARRCRSLASAKVVPKDALSAKGVPLSSSPKPKPAVAALGRLPLGKDTRDKAHAARAVHAQSAPCVRRPIWHNAVGNYTHSNASLGEAHAAQQDGRGPPCVGHHGI